jgi:hypothetical protein
MNVIGTLLLLFASFAGLIIYLTYSQMTGLLVLVTSFSVISYFVWQASYRNSAFDSIAIGSPAAQVIVEIGNPPRVTNGTEWVEEGFKRSASELIPGCVKEYWYASFLYPERLSFCFDSNQNLIHKYRYLLW